MGVAKYIKNEKDEVQDVIFQSGIHIKPVYTQKDLEEIGFDPGRDRFRCHIDSSGIAIVPRGGTIIKSSRE